MYLLARTGVQHACDVPNALGSWGQASPTPALTPRFYSSPVRSTRVCMEKDLATFAVHGHVNAHEVIHICGREVHASAVTHYRLLLSVVMQAACKVLSG